MIKALNVILPYSDFLYLLQLEEYEGVRYLRLLPRFFLRRGFQRRQKLVITSRIRVTLALSVLITLLASFAVSVLTVLLVPVWVYIANLILDPVYSQLKVYVQSKAAKYFKENFKGKVIAVAGSFGKTTTKNYIYELIRYNYKTQLIPGNINTPTGIANWILKNLDKSTEILIVEMDTYFVGEIKRSCRITPPDIAVLTNVGDQHLERLGTKANLKKALGEIFKYAKPNAVKIQNKKTNLDYALAVAKELKIPKDIIEDTKKKLTKPDRRGNIIEMHGFKTIDESYNISATTAKRGLDNALLLAKKHNKKLIVITGGIPELGKENKNANLEYGELLKKSNVEVVLLTTILYRDIESGAGKVKLADSMNNAWELIMNDFDPKKYIVLMQPELGDNYY